MAMTCGKVVWSRRTGRVFMSWMNCSVLIVKVLAVQALRRAFSTVCTRAVAAQRNQRLAGAVDRGGQRSRGDTPDGALLCRSLEPAASKTGGE